MAKKKENDIVAGMVGILLIGVFGTVFLLIVGITIYSIPLIIVAIGGYIAYQSSVNSPMAKEQKMKALTHNLYEQVKASNPSAPTTEEFIGPIYDSALSVLPEEVGDEAIRIIARLYEHERFTGDVPKPPAVCNSFEGAKYRDYLSQYSAKTVDPTAIRCAESTLTECFRRTRSALPSSPEATMFNMPVSMYLGDDAGDVVQDILASFFDEECIRLNIFNDMRDQLRQNLADMSKIDLYEQDASKVIYPKDYKGDRPVTDYLKGTPFDDLFDAGVPVSLGERIFDTTWCVGQHGRGKTQLIQYMISHYLEEVENNEATIIVMDGQDDKGGLVDTLTQLKVFAPGESLEGKLVVLRPSIENPPALNLFDFATERLNTYDREGRQEIIRTTIELVGSVIDAVMGGETFTDKQRGMFNYLLRLMIEQPESDMSTFRQLLNVKKREDLKPFEVAIEHLSKSAQDFFYNDYLDGDNKRDKSEYQQTKEQLRWRLVTLSSEGEYFEGMWESPRTKIDFFKEFNESKVIVLDTSKLKLGSDGTRILGRYYIAQILKAAQERGRQAKSQRKTVYFFADEAHDFIDKSKDVETIIDQCRKMRISAFFAHQRVQQITDTNVRNALSGAGIFFANHSQQETASYFASRMKTTTEFINQPTGRFALYHRDLSGAIAVNVKGGVLEKMGKMTQEEQQAVRQENLSKYHYSVEEEVKEPEKVAEVEATAKEDDDTPGDIALSDEM